MNKNKARNKNHRPQARMKVVVDAWSEFEFSMWYNGMMVCIPQTGKTRVSLSTHSSPPFLLSPLLYLLFLPFIPLGKTWCLI